MKIFFDVLIGLRTKGHFRFLHVYKLPKYSLVLFKDGFKVGGLFLVSFAENETVICKKINEIF
jgi:hypothetical protein